MKYPEGCEIILTYREWFEAGVICDKKIFAKTLLKEKLRSRRLAIMLIDFMKDESVRLSKINSTKNPDTRLLFDDLPSVADDVKRTFYLIIDIDETNAEEIQVVKYMYATYKDEDVSYSELANRCNDLGYEPRFASMFDQHTIQGMLMNLVYVKDGT